MKIFSAAVPGSLLVLVALTAATSVPWQQTGSRSAAPEFAPVLETASLARHVTTRPPAESLTPVILQYCVICHNDVALTGNLSLQSFVVE